MAEKLVQELLRIVGEKEEGETVIRLAELTDLYRSKPDPIIESVFQPFYDRYALEDKYIKDFSRRRRKTITAIENLNLPEALNLANKYKSQQEVLQKLIFDAVGTAAQMREREDFIRVVSNLSRDELPALAAAYHDKSGTTLRIVFKSVISLADEYNQEAVLKVVGLAYVYKNKPAEVIESIFRRVYEAAGKSEETVFREIEKLSQAADAYEDASPEKEKARERIRSLVSDYFTLEEIIDTMTYSHGDPRFGITDLYGKKTSEARVMSRVNVRTGEYRRTQCSYQAQKKLTSLGAPAISPLIEALLQGETHFADVKIPEGTIDKRYAGVRIGGLNDSFEDERLGSCRWNQVLASSLEQMFIQHSPEEVIGEIKRNLSESYKSLLKVEKKPDGEEEEHQREKAENKAKKNYDDLIGALKYMALPRAAGTSLAGIMKAKSEAKTKGRPAYMLTAPAMLPLTEEFIRIYQSEWEGSSYSSRCNKNETKTPQKAVFRALAFCAKNGNELASNFLMEDADKFPPDSRHLDFLVQNRIVPSRGFFHRLRDTLMQKKFRDIEGRLPEQVDALLTAYFAKQLR